MRQHRTRVPSYRLHKGSGQAVVTLQGKDHYLGKHGTPESQARYERLIATYLANGRQLPPEETRPETYTVGDLCYDFLKSAEKELWLPDGRQSREVRNIEIALRPLVAMFLDVQAEDFGPKDLMLYRQDQVEAGLARKTVNQRVGIVRRAFRWAARFEKMSASVCHGLETVEGLKRGRCRARETDPVQPVPEAHIRAALPFMPTLVRAMVELQLLTAARPGEIVILRPCDIDMTGGVWLYRPTAHKNSWRGLDRIVPIGPQGQGIIRPLLRPGLQGKFLFSPIEREKERVRRMRARGKGTVGDQPQGQPKANSEPKHRVHYDTQTYGQAVRRACRHAAVPEWTPGRLRHNAATTTHRRFGLEGASALLGHKLVETTQLYSDISLMTAVEIAAEIG